MLNVFKCLATASPLVHVIPAIKMIIRDFVVPHEFVSGAPDSRRLSSGRLENNQRHKSAFAEIVLSPNTLQ